MYIQKHVYTKECIYKRMYTYILYDPCVVLPSDWDPGFAAKTMDNNLMA